MEGNCLFFSFCYQEQTVNVAVAFEAQGGWREEKDAIAVTVLQVTFIQLSFKLYLLWCLSYDTFFMQFLYIYISSWPTLVAC
jgi:hypothetical protein